MTEFSFKESLGDKFQLKRKEMDGEKQKAENFFLKKMVNSVAVYIYISTSIKRIE